MPDWHFLMSPQVLITTVIAAFAVANAYSLWVFWAWSRNPNRVPTSMQARVRSYVLGTFLGVAVLVLAIMSFLGLWTWTRSLTITLLIWDGPIVLLLASTLLMSAKDREQMLKPVVGVIGPFLIGFPVSFALVLSVILWLLWKKPVATFFERLWDEIVYAWRGLCNWVWNTCDGIFTGATNLRYAVFAGLFTWLTGNYVHPGYRHRDYRY